VGVDWPLCVPQPWREIDAHGAHVSCMNAVFATAPFIIGRAAVGQILLIYILHCVQCAVISTRLYAACITVVSTSAVPVIAEAPPSLYFHLSYIFGTTSRTRSCTSTTNRKSTVLRQIYIRVHP